jgi:hypothetical protein
MPIPPTGFMPFFAATTPEPTATLMTASPSGGNSGTTPSEPPPDWLSVVLASIAGIKFGSIQITIHDRQVIQVEATEKTRFSRTSINQGK